MRKTLASSGSAKAALPLLESTPVCRDSISSIWHMSGTVGIDAPIYCPCHCHWTGTELRNACKVEQLQKEFWELRNSGLKSSLAL